MRLVEENLPPADYVNPARTQVEAAPIPQHEPLTQWLSRMREGDPDALDAVVPLLYKELRAIAGAQLKSERADHTLSATALVHEAYFRLARQHLISADDRKHFLSIASNTMRRILVDSARAKKRLKRGAGAAHMELSEVEEFLTDSEAEEVIAIDEALVRLAEVNERGAKVVEHRFFGGFSLEDTAASLDVSTKTVQRSWVTARAWLRKEILKDL